MTRNNNTIFDGFIPLPNDEKSGRCKRLLNAVVRWWHRLIGRTVIYCGMDVGNGKETTCITEYDKKTGVITVLDVKERATT